MTALLLVLALAAADEFLDEAPVQDPDRVPAPEEAVKALKEKNIFSPYRPKPTVSRAADPAKEGEEKKEAGPAPRPGPPVLTGIVLDPEGGHHRALVEDRNQGDLRRFTEPKFLKAGEELLEYTIVSVSVNRVTVRKGEEEPEELSVGDVFPGEPGIPGPGGATSGSRPSTVIKSLDDEKLQDTLQKLRERRRRERE